MQILCFCVTQSHGVRLWRSLRSSNEQENERETTREREREENGFYYGVEKHMEALGQHEKTQRNQITNTYVWQSGHTHSSSSSTFGDLSNNHIASHLFHGQNAYLMQQKWNPGGLFFFNTSNPFKGDLLDMENILRQSLTAWKCCVAIWPYWK